MPQKNLLRLVDHHHAGHYRDNFMGYRLLCLFGAHYNARGRVRLESRPGNGSVFTGPAHLGRDGRAGRILSGSL